MGVYLLDKNTIAFPDPSLARSDGLLAVGGDLSVERLLLAYGNGIFPWYEEGQDIMWWSPHERYIIRPANIHVSRSMKKFYRQHEIEIRVNRDFAFTMHKCREKMEDKEGTWITDDMEKAYYELHKRGYAASVEAYIDGNLAGGLYGVDLGMCFMGESMYSEMENGSKIALIELAHLLEMKDYRVIDCQFHTDHLESMGGETVTGEEYRRLLGKNTI